MSDTTRDLTTGPLWKVLMLVSAPMVGGIFAVLSVGLADAYFLGKLGEEPLAAVGYIYPVTTAITSLSIGLSAGANAAISQAIGRKAEQSEICRVTLHAVGLGLALSILVALAFWLGHEPLFRLMGAGDSVMKEISAYAFWWALSFPPLVGMMLTQASYRAHGQAGLAAGFLVLAAVINIGLTPLLIFGLGPVPGFETAGAGQATFAARLVTAVASIGYAVHIGRLFIGRTPFADLLDSVRQIFSVGAPAAFSNAINPAGMAAVTAAVATLGEAAVGGFGAATRVQSLAIVPLLALSSGIGPVVGQNFGAEDHDRARGAMTLTFVLCLGYGLLAATLLTVFAGPIAAFIATEGETVDFTAAYLRVVSWSFFGYGMVVTANAAMNARSKAVWSMSLSLGRILLVYLPLAWLGVAAMGYEGILGAAVLANLLGGVAAIAAAWQTGLFRFETGPFRRAVQLS